MEDLGFEPGWVSITPLVSARATDLILVSGDDITVYAESSWGGLLFGSTKVSSLAVR